MKKIIISIVFILLSGLIIYAQENRPLKILEKPKPTYPEIKGTVHVQGTITLRVEFRDDGTIGKIAPISTLPYGFTERAIEAAKKIKFEPAIQDSKPITVVKTVLYNLDGINGWQDFANESSESASLPETNEKAEAIIKKAVEKLGGDKYLQVRTQIGKGRYSQIQEKQVASFQSFTDIIVYPDKERTEFKGGGKSVQVNAGETGWSYDGANDILSAQSAEQIAAYKRYQRANLDNFLRGIWRKENAKLEYAGRRQAGLGVKNDVLRLTFADNFAVEFEFSDDGMPRKSIYRRGGETEENPIFEEDRFAQFIEVQGVKTPFIVDHYTGGAQVSRINYESVEFNKNVSDSIFVQPKNTKGLK